jgi:cobalt-zinc-cadmium resistance protein CzcA
MAIIGGVLGLALTGTAFSISAAIGFVALFGIAVMDGILW